MRLFGLSGSLRAASTNSALLRAATGESPRGLALDLYDRLGALPIFNPDHEGEALPAEVRALEARIEASAGLVVACPEYAHGLPGGLKNALDWLVSGSAVVNKPVALFHASPRSAFLRSALTEVLNTMSMRIVIEITVPLMGLTPEAVAALLAAPATRQRLQDALRDFSRLIAAAQHQR